MTISGICAYNLVPVRAQDSDKSEMVTQLLFGDAYEITEESDNRKWVKIITGEDSYEGWIDKKLHMETAKKAVEILESSNHFCSESVGYITADNIERPIFFGSYLPFFDGSFVYIGNKKYLFKGKAERNDKKMASDKILEYAQSFLGTPYLWGGRSHAGIDCSGLVQMVFRSCGYTLKRDAWQQASMGSQVENLEKAKSGDLAFFCNDQNRVIHVGILTDNQTIIHAHGEVRTDKIDGTGIINSDTGLYSHKLDAIRKII